MENYSTTDDTSDYPLTSNSQQTGVDASATDGLLKLIPLDTSHIDYVMTWVNDPEVIKNFQNFGTTITRQAELDFIEEMSGSLNDRIFSIFTDNGEYVGQGGINQISWANKLGRLSIFIVKSQQHKGFGREAIKALLTKAFTDIGMNKVWLMAYSSNTRAIAMYEKIGFQKEGLLRQEYYWQDTYHDICRMGILRDEWLTEANIPRQ